ncbi:protein PET117 homolog, mitochondrial [Aethina tumida]|uniref:protein PET117 homolog, mitochondrial n=1 Tax=Aethina tumida TaxID=116153 RepID=UPI00096AEA57|nr:protein PET117 homolog, mitochondrial [Aethina tumida]
MSSLAKAVLGGACAFSLGIIGYVHYRQFYDRQQMHEGVLRDIERRQKRKAENLYNLQKQIDFTKEIKRNREEIDNNVT